MNALNQLAIIDVERAVAPKDYEAAGAKLKAVRENKFSHEDTKCEAGLYLGVIAYKQKRYEEAYRDFQDILDHDQASLFTKAKAEYWLAVMHYFGFSVNINHREARSALEKVVYKYDLPENSGIKSKAFYRLARMDFYGEGLETGSNYENAKKLWILSLPGLEVQDQLNVKCALAIIAFKKASFSEAYSLMTEVFTNKSSYFKTALSATLYLARMEAKGLGVKRNAEQARNRLEYIINYPSKKVESKKAEARELLATLNLPRN